MSVNFENITILLVDNIKEDRQMLSKMLSKYFKNIIEAVDGKEGYELYKKHSNIDIIISDIDMPNINGLDFLKLIRLSDLSIPFIIISANNDPVTLLSAIDLNINSYLHKPIEINKLFAKIDILCEKKMYKQKLLLKQNEIENYILAVDKVALIYKMNGDGNIVYMNDSMLLVSEYDKEDIASLKFRDIIHPDIPPQYINETWEHIKSGKLWKGNTKFISKNNEVFYLNNSVFKIENNDKDEYVTISFLTTKENLEKRDFHKKVLLNIKESNAKELISNKKILELTKEITRLKKVVGDTNYISTQELNQKILQRDNQLQKYEKDISELNEKYSKMLKLKRDETERQINSVQEHKLKTDKLIKDNNTINNLLQLSAEKVKSLLSDVEKKNKLINDLRFIISELDNKK